MAARKPLVTCQRNLLVLWVAGSIPPAVVMFIQSLNDYYGDANPEAWGWLLSALMPTLSLMVGSYLAAQTSSKENNKTVDSLAFWLAALFSLLYLCVVNSTLFYLPFSSTPPAATMNRTHLFLGSLQGVVGSCLGVFFVSGRTDAASQPGGVAPEDS